MEIKKDIVNLEQLKKNPVFQLSLSAKELFHSNFLYWIASSYPKLFNGVMKKLDVNIKLSEDSAENIVEREYNHFDFCICKEDEKKKKKISFVLENKFKSIPYKAQLEKYNGQIKKINGKVDIPRVLLTLATEFEGYDAKNTDNVNGWKVITYSKYIEAIRDVINEYNLDTFDKELINKYCNFVETIVAFMNKKLRDNLSWNKMLEVSKELEPLRLHDVWQKLYASKLFTQLKYTPIPVKDFSVLMKNASSLDQNQKPIPGKIYKELSYGTSGVYISVAIPVKVNDNWFCVIIQVQGHDYRIGFIVKKNQLDRFENIVKHFSDLLAGTKLKRGTSGGIINRDTYCVYDSDYPFYYRKWADANKLSAANMAEKLKKDIETIQKIIIPLLPPQTSVPPF